MEEPCGLVGELGQQIGRLKPLIAHLAEVIPDNI